MLQTQTFKLMKIKVLLTLFICFLGVSFEPCYAQSWVKATKTVSKQAAKALKSGKTTNKTKVYPQKQNPNKNGYSNAGRSAATAAQYEKRQCTTCSGYGWYYYNGIRYKCSSCSGNGYKIVKR